MSAHEFISVHDGQDRHPEIISDYLEDKAFNIDTFMQASVYDDGRVDNYKIQYTNRNGYSHAIVFIEPLTIGASSEYLPDDLPKNTQVYEEMDDEVGLILTKTRNLIEVPVMLIGFSKGSNGFDTKLSTPLYRENNKNRIAVAGKFTLDPFDIVDLFTELEEKDGQAIRGYFADGVTFLLPLGKFHTGEGETLRASIHDDGSKGRHLKIEIALDPQEVTCTLPPTKRPQLGINPNTTYSPILEAQIPMGADAPWVGFERVINQLDTSEEIVQAVGRHIYQQYQPYIRLADPLEQIEIDGAKGFRI